MNFCGIELGTTQIAALASFAFAVASEVIGRSKLKENSVVDVVMKVAKHRVFSSIASAHTPKAADRIKNPGRAPSTSSQGSTKRRGRPPAKTASKS